MDFFEEFDQTPEPGRIKNPQHTCWFPVSPYILTSALPIPVLEEKAGRIRLACDEYGWVRWPRGATPIDPETSIEVEYLTGERELVEAGQLNWISTTFRFRLNDPEVPSS